MIRYVIYSTSTGVIRAIVTGSRELAELNIRTGESLLEHDGFVSGQLHRVDITVDPHVVIPK
ncbi:hypothetical protein GGE65_007733 [Skermanella aerolata]|uniref:hypothetical protein n=1 Tax=Skermanella aerolata TaxID=393310 RepID=UPI003D2567A1